MKIFILFFLLTFQLSIHAQNMGVKLNPNSLPNTTLDVNGSVSFREGTALPLVNGTNNNVSLGELSFVRITSPVLAYNITGFANGQDGRILVLLNATNVTLTLKNESTLSTAANRIQTSVSDIALLSKGTATLMYNLTLQRWVIISVQGTTPSAPQLLIKSVTEGITNTGTLQADNELFFTVGANEKWQIEAVLDVDGPDIVYGFEIPSGDLAVNILHYSGNGAGTAQFYMIRANSTASGRCTISGSGETSTHFTGIITTGSTGGTAKLLWAQNSSNGSATMVKKDSWLRITRIQ